MNDDCNAHATSAHDCPRCGAAALVGRHCKLLCPGCGYVESCEDLFPTCHAALIGDEAPRAAKVE